MSNFREVKDDLLKDWLYFRDEGFCSNVSIEDKKHNVKFDEISENIIKSIPRKNQNFVQKQLNKLNENFLDYSCYWNEKYYRNGFCDAVQILNGCMKE